MKQYIGHPNAPTLLATVSSSQLNYIDNGATIGTGMMVYYSIKAVDTQSKKSTFSDYANIESSSWQMGKKLKVQQLPTQVELTQNYPNPFNPTTTISYGIPEAGTVHLTVYDNLGREVATVVNEYKNAGYYQANFDASKLSSGITLMFLKAAFIHARTMFCR